MTTVISNPAEYFGPRNFGTSINYEEGEFKAWVNRSLLYKALGLSGGPYYNACDNLYAVLRQGRPDDSSAAGWYAVFAVGGRKLILLIDDVQRYY